MVWPEPHGGMNTSHNAQQAKAPMRKKLEEAVATKRNDIVEVLEVGVDDAGAGQRSTEFELIFVGDVSALRIHSVPRVLFLCDPPGPAWSSQSSFFRIDPLSPV